MCCAQRVLTVEDDECIVYIHQKIPPRSNDLDDRGTRAKQVSSCLLHSMIFRVVCIAFMSDAAVPTCHKQVVDVHNIFQNPRQHTGKGYHTNPPNTGQHQIESPPSGTHLRACGRCGKSKPNHDYSNNQRSVRAVWEEANPTSLTSTMRWLDCWIQVLFFDSDNKSGIQRHYWKL